MAKKSILVVFGTRPEAIKLAPLIKQLRDENLFDIKVCSSSQHVELLEPMLTFFNIKLDYNLNIMSENQTLFSITEKCLHQLEKIIKKEKPTLIIVQGDTSTAFSGALAGFYSKVPVAHIEAGLRTNDTQNPYPEEMNRKLIAQLASYHFAPNEANKITLAKEGIVKNVWVVGNTGIDAFLMTKKYVNNGYKPPFTIDKSIKHILVTGHRRENIGKPFSVLCDELLKIVNEKTRIIFPLHLNPKLTTIAKRKLSNHKNILLTEPQAYPEFVWMMQQSDLIITDSGGIQEEAPYLGVPVLVTRKITERQESLTDNIRLIDIEKDCLKSNVEALISAKKTVVNTPYGDGHSAFKISKRLTNELLV